MKVCLVWFRALLHALESIRFVRLVVRPLLFADKEEEEEQEKDLARAQSRIVPIVAVELSTHQRDVANTSFHVLRWLDHADHHGAAEAEVEGRGGWVIQGEHENKSHTDEEVTAAWCAMYHRQKGELPSSPPLPLSRGALGAREDLAAEEDMFDMTLTLSADNQHTVPLHQWQRDMFKLMPEALQQGLDLTFVFLDANKQRIDLPLFDASSWRPAAARRLPFVFGWEQTIFPIWNTAELYRTRQAFEEHQLQAAATAQTMEAFYE